MQLEEFGPDDVGAIAAAVAIENSQARVDAPWVHRETLHHKEMELRHGWDGEVARHFLLPNERGEAVGYASLGASEWDNTDLAWLGVAVHPEHRRLGHGSAILDGLLRLVEGAGRHLVGVDGWESPGVLAFAARHGFVKVSQAINRRLYLEHLDLDAIRRLRAEAAAYAADYELVRIDGHTPHELLPAVAGLTGAINDAPMDELEYEDEVHPPERIARYEDAVIDSGNRLLRLVARHRATGELGGHTVIAVDLERPELADQHDTSVSREHRGHRLGLLLKAEMLLWLAEVEPQVREIDTWNAESNQHMIAVNQPLGYQVLGRELQFQRRLGVNPEPR